jgi:hypothetical protein
MPANRRTFLKSAAALACTSAVSHAAEQTRSSKPSLATILDAPVLKLDGLDRPVKIKSVELLKNGKVYLLRTRSTDGVEAVTVPHPSRMAVAYPIFLKLIAPMFVGKDARDLESLLWDLYRHSDNYKLQGLGKRPS